MTGTTRITAAIPKDDFKQTMQDLAAWATKRANDGTGEFKCEAFAISVFQSTRTPRAYVDVHAEDTNPGTIEHFAAGPAHDAFTTRTLANGRITIYGPPQREYDATRAAIKTAVNTLPAPSALTHAQRVAMAALYAAYNVLDTNATPQGRVRGVETSTDAMRVLIHEVA